MSVPNANPSAVPTYVLLYVRNPAESAAFYAAVRGGALVEQSPTFALFAHDPDGHRVRVFAPAAA